jgi:hypothetical protein
MLIKATAQALLLGEGPLAGIFGTKSTVTGGTGGILGSIFGGFRAEGGPVAPGRAYVVGEKRPEVFVPRVPGSILPKIPTGGSVQSSTVFSAPITVNVQGGSRGAEADSALSEKIGQELEQRVRAIVGKELRGQMRPGGLLNNMRWS